MPNRPACIRLTRPPKPSTKFSATAAMESTMTRVNRRMRNGLSIACAISGTHASALSSSTGAAMLIQLVRVLSAMDGEQSSGTPGEDHRHQHENGHAAERWGQQHAAERIDHAD